MTSIHLPSSQDEPRWHGRVAVLVLTIITLIAMGRICGDDFSWWDDPGTIHHNPWMQPPSSRTLTHYWMTPENGLYIPATYTVWAGIALLAKVPSDALGIALNPWLFHSASVLCHLLAALTVYRILRLLNADVFASTSGALIFAVHPVQVEAVAWASGLKDVLSGLFALVAIWQYVSFSRSDLQGRASWWRFIFATLFFVLAMLAKPSAMALPLTALAIDRWAVGRPWRKVLPGPIAWVLIALPLAVIARSVQDASNTPMPPLFLRPLVATDSLAFYMGKIVWPAHLIVDYSRNPKHAFAHGWPYWDWIFPVGVAAFLIAGARRRPVLLAAGVAFVAGCLPVLGFTPAMFQFVSTTTDHYLYTSMFGVALLVGWLLSVRPTIPLRLATCLIILALVPLTIQQAGYWQNDIDLFSHAVTVNPESQCAYLNLGGTYERLQDFPRSVACYRNAVRTDPEYALSWGELANALSLDGKSDEAIAAAKEAIELQTKYPNLRFNWAQDNALLGQLLYDRSQFAEAIPYMQTAMDLEPANQHLADELQEAKKRAATQPWHSTIRQHPT